MFYSNDAALINLNHNWHRNNPPTHLYNPQEASDRVLVKFKKFRGNNQTVRRSKRPLIMAASESAVLVPKQQESCHKHLVGCKFLLAKTHAASTPALSVLNIQQLPTAAIQKVTRLFPLGS